MAARYGSFAWAAGGGALTSAEKLGEILRGASALFRQRRDRWRAAMGLGERPFRQLLAEVPRPTSPAIQAAEVRLARLPTHLAQHCRRTYAFAAMLGARDGLRFEAELLLLASLLHDLGLANPLGAPCFARRGAEEAARLLLDAGAPPAQAGAVAEAICLHLNVTPAGSVEAKLLRRGAGLDVVGEGFFTLAQESRREVLAEWPRGQFAERLTSELREEARRHPRTRTGLLCGALGFPRLIQQAERRFTRDRPGDG